MVLRSVAIVLILLTLVPAVAATNDASKTAELDSWIKIPTINISRQDRLVGNNFLRLYRLSRKGILNKKLIKNLKSSMAKNSTFADYRIWVDGVDELVNLKSFKGLKDSCEKYSNKNYSSHIKVKLNKNIKNICFDRYLKELEKKISFTKSFHKRQIKYINNNISSIMSRERSVITFLSNLKSVPDKHELYSKAIVNHLMLHKLTPTTALIKELKVTPTLTRFIQTRELGDRSQRYQFFKTLLTYKNDLEESLDKKMDRKIIEERKIKLVDYFQSTYEFMDQDRASLNMISIAKDFTRAGKYEISRSLLNQVLLKKNREYEVQTKFELLWTYILENDYKKAYNSMVADFLKDTNSLSNNSQLAFWSSSVLEKVGKRDEAMKLLELVIKKNPLSYYAILSAKKLSKHSALLANDIYTKTFNKPSRVVASENKIDTDWLKRIQIWGDLGSGYFIRQEILHKEGAKNYEDHVLTAAKLLSEKGDYLESFKVVISGLNNNSIGFDKKVLEILFPTPYFHQIKKEIDKEFDPVIALSLIRQESGFNRRARSRVGARGLMQLMPATARRFKRRLKTSHLYNPSTNINIGTKYFNNLLNRYDNNLVYSLAAYNAGEHRVDRWQSDFLSNDSILKDIENIPFRETRKYVKLIFRNIFFYKMLLKEGGNDEHKYNQIFDLHLGFNR